MNTSELIPFREALQSRAVRELMPTNLTSLELMQISAAIRERAMFSAQTLSESYLQKIHDLVDQILNPVTDQRSDGTPFTSGMDWATARLEAKQQLMDEGYLPRPDERGTILDLSSNQRINLVIKTNVEMAQGYGQWRQGQSETALDLWPAQELFRAEGRKEPRDWITRWKGAGGTLVGGGRMIALKDDPIWTEISAFGVPYPPYDFNSGMWVRDVTREDAVAFGLMGENDTVEPQRRGFEMT